jgi:hypothetical protein
MTPPLARSGISSTTTWSPQKETDVHGGYAEVHRKGEFCCKLLVTKSQLSKALLLAELRGKCVAWVEEWQSRSPV